MGRSSSLGPFGYLVVIVGLALFSDLAKSNPGLAFIVIAGFVVLLGAMFFDTTGYRTHVGWEGFMLVTKRIPVVLGIIVLGFLAAMLMRT